MDDETRRALDALLELLATSNLEIRLPDGRWVPFSAMMLDGVIIKHERQDAQSRQV